MADKEFVKGMLVKAPSDKTPDFVKCHLSVKRKELIEWLKERGEEWINLDVKVGRTGRWYVDVNNWKPKKKEGDIPF